MENLVVRNMYNGNLLRIPNNDPEPNIWFKLVVILLISFLIIKILINSL